MRPGERNIIDNLRLKYRAQVAQIGDQELLRRFEEFNTSDKSIPEIDWLVGDIEAVDPNEVEVISYPPEPPFSAAELTTLKDLLWKLYREQHRAARPHGALILQVLNLL